MNPLPATIAITVIALLYAGLCWVSPFTRCPWCKGAGIRNGVLLRRPRPCRWCHGHRLRLRWGRRIYAHLLQLHRGNVRASATRKD